MTKSANNRGRWVLEFTEDYMTRAEAMSREK
jgi:hypothetical protein